MNEGKQTSIMRMFDRIANTYDSLNGLLSFGIDRYLRKELANALPDKPNLKVLDVATGTADSLIAIAKARPEIAKAVGVDISENMLALAYRKIERDPALKKLKLIYADASNLPFDNESFDAVSIAFGVRNVVQLNDALVEFWRVLNEGGSLCVLEFSKPENKLIRWLFFLYLRHVLPYIGWFVSGDKEGYRYLNKTIETFPCGDDFCQLLKQAGFVNIKTKKLALGVATIYQGSKI